MKKGQIEELEDINYEIRTNWIGFFPVSYTLSATKIWITFWCLFAIADETCAIVLHCDALVYPFALQKWLFDFCGIRANSPWKITCPAIYPLLPTGPANGGRVVACDGLLSLLATGQALILRSAYWEYRPPRHPRPTHKLLLPLCKNLLFACSNFFWRCLKIQTSLLARTKKGTAPIHEELVCPIPTSRWPKSLRNLWPPVQSAFTAFCA